MNSGDVVAGRFALEERVGAGGMGVVFRARDHKTGGAVAVKVLEGRHPTEIERARREAEALSRVSHPAIVRLVADGVLDSGELYLAMEWIEGTTVADRLTKHGFSIREAVAVGRRLADALAAAHRSLVLHRDIKPTNVLLPLVRDSPGSPGGDHGAAMLIDFGVARMSDSVRTLTRTGATIGTPGYMSPEQARAEPALTPASDVFGLGCLLYECLTGRPAFSGSMAAAVLAKILLADPPPLASVCPEAPPRLVALVERMLAKHASERVPDCAAVVAELDALGPLADGPRRTSRALVDQATRVSAAPGEVHCIVAAVRGSPDDMLDPPEQSQRGDLDEVARGRSARLQVMATGSVIAHLTGAAAETARRAALLALDLRAILPGWSIAISSLRADIAETVDDGSTLASRSAIAAIFGPPGTSAIAIDRSTAPLLAGEFEIALGAGGDPQLVGRAR